MNAVIELAKDLIGRHSVTPKNAGCLESVEQMLQPVGFQSLWLPYGEVENTWFSHGSGGPTICFLGHIDVVPTGPLERWQSHPFQPEIRNGFLYGRGAADMKGGVAAFTVAAKRFVENYPDHAGQIAILLTSDEEAEAIDGIRKVVPALQERNIKIDYCIVGEPTSEKTLADVVKIGRRGSLTCYLSVKGKQGHAAYPHLSDNAIHKALPALQQLVEHVWDHGNDFFPPTTLQIVDIQAGAGASNVIPGELKAIFNLRYNTQATAAQLQTKIEQMLLNTMGSQIECVWRVHAEPYLTQTGKLISTSQGVIERLTGKPTTLSTAGGASDGRFIAPTGAQVIEIGPLNATIHQVDECVAVDDLILLEKIYFEILCELFLVP